MVGKLEQDDRPQDESEENPDINPVRFFHRLWPRHGGCYGDANAHCYSKQTEGKNRQELCHPTKQTSDDN